MFFSVLEDGDAFLGISDTYMQCVCLRQRLCVVSFILLFSVKQEHISTRFLIFTDGTRHFFFSLTYLKIYIAGQSNRLPRCCRFHKEFIPSAFPKSLRSESAICRSWSRRHSFSSTNFPFSSPVCCSLNSPLTFFALLFSWTLPHQHG